MPIITTRPRIEDQRNISTNASFVEEEQVILASPKPAKTTVKRSQHIYDVLRSLVVSGALLWFSYRFPHTYSFHRPGIGKYFLYVGTSVLLTPFAGLLVRLPVRWIDRWLTGINNRWPARRRKKVLHLAGLCFITAIPEIILFVSFKLKWIHQNKPTFLVGIIMEGLSSISMGLMLMLLGVWIYGKRKTYKDN